MSEYRQVVDELRSYAQSMDFTLTTRQKELVAEFAQLCDAANARLRRCEEYLSKGLRCEAIQFAQAEPTLLDVVTALDFPERQLFEERLLGYGMPLPPRLLLGTAEALNRAYAEVQPLEARLRVHRRLALSRAPLAERLGLLRELAMVDTKSQVWLEDLQSFEAARLAEIECDIAAASRSPSRVAELAAELEEPGWFTRPPALLVQRIRGILQAGEQQKVRAELEQVVEGLHRAMASLDLHAAIPLRSRFEQLVASAGLTQNDPLARKAHAALEWAAEMEREQARELDFQSRLAAVDAAIDKKADPVEVAGLYDQASNRGRKVPAMLKQRFEMYLQGHQEERQWREWIILSGVFAGGAVILLAIIIAVTR